MPWRLILFIVSLVLITFFIGFNLENACNVSFGFKQFDNVPIFLTVMFSFVAGILVTLPFTFGKRRQKTEKFTAPVKMPKIIKSPKMPKDPNSVPSTGGATEKKDLISFFANKKTDSPVENTTASKPALDKADAPTPADSSADTPPDQAKN